MKFLVFNFWVQIIATIRCIFNWFYQLVILNRSHIVQTKNFAYWFRYRVTSSELASSHFLPLSTSASTNLVSYSFYIVFTNLNELTISTTQINFLMLYQNDTFFHTQQISEARIFLLQIQNYETVIHLPLFFPSNSADII